MINHIHNKNTEFYVFQRWVNAIHEHSAYSSHYLYGIEQQSESDDDYGNKIIFAHHLKDS